MERQDKGERSPGLHALMAISFTCVLAPCAAEAWRIGAVLSPVLAGHTPTRARSHSGVIDVESVAGAAAGGSLGDQERYPSSSGSASGGGGTGEDGGGAVVALSPRPFTAHARKTSSLMSYSPQQQLEVCEGPSSRGGDLSAAGGPSAGGSGLEDSPSGRSALPFGQWALWSSGHFKSDPERVPLSPQLTPQHHHRKQASGLKGGGGAGGIGGAAAAAAAGGGGGGFGARLASLLPGSMVRALAEQPGAVKMIGVAVLWSVTGCLDKVRDSFSSESSFPFHSDAL